MTEITYKEYIYLYYYLSPKRIKVSRFLPRCDYYQLDKLVKNKLITKEIKNNLDKQYNRIYNGTNFSNSFKNNIKFKDLCYLYYLYPVKLEFSIFSLKYNKIKLLYFDCLFDTIYGDLNYFLYMYKLAIEKKSFKLLNILDKYYKLLGINNYAFDYMYRYDYTDENGDFDGYEGIKEFENYEICFVSFEEFKYLMAVLNGWMPYINREIKENNIYYRTDNDFLNKINELVYKNPESKIYKNYNLYFKLNNLSKKNNLKRWDYLPPN